MTIVSLQQKLWEEAREWAVSEILAKYHKELEEAQRKHFSRLNAYGQDFCLCPPDVPAVINGDGVQICTYCHRPRA